MNNKEFCNKLKYYNEKREREEREYLLILINDFLQFLIVNGGSYTVKCRDASYFDSSRFNYKDVLSMKEELLKRGFIVEQSEEIFYRTELKDGWFTSYEAKVPYIAKVITVRCDCKCE